MKIGTTSNIEMQCGPGVPVLVVPYDHIEFPTSIKAEFALNASTILQPSKMEEIKVSLQVTSYLTVFIT